jgi:hypothetical protein
MTPDLPDLLKGKMAIFKAILRAQNLRGRIISENSLIINQTQPIPQCKYTHLGLVFHGRPVNLRSLLPQHGYVRCAKPSLTYYQPQLAAL